eukprot:Lithocolla_globosa_v1_NODE_963_length_3017_cov_27.468940.p1 type:complete len:204 gc:universal NODE_963_length_3017_cov_27.468940:2202-2813(+)
MRQALKEIQQLPQIHAKTVIFDQKILVAHYMDRDMGHVKSVAYPDLPANTESFFAMRAYNELMNLAQTNQYVYFIVMLDLHDYYCYLNTTAKTANISSPSGQQGDLVFTKEYNNFKQMLLGKEYQLNYVTTPVYQYDEESSCTLVCLEWMVMLQWYGTNVMHKPLTSGHADVFFLFVHRLVETMRPSWTGKKTKSIITQDSKV